MFVFKVFNYTEKRDNLFRMEDILPDKYKEAFTDFIKHYDIDTIVPYPNRKLALKNKVERTCRFCGKKNPEAKFRKIAHLIPMAIGNKFLIHDSECDSCNEEFGLFEQSFVNFIGIYRTVDKIKGYEGVPKFKSKDNKLSVSMEKDEEGNEQIVLDINEERPVLTEKDSQIFTAIKHPYIPLNVMKCFYKIGYSLLRNDEIGDYKITLEIIKSKKHDTNLKELAKVFRFIFPVPIMGLKPFIMTCHKKAEYKSKNIPTKIIIIYFGRFMYQFFLINDKDKFLYTPNSECSWIRMQPYNNEIAGDSNGEEINLSGISVKKDDADSFKVYFTS